MDNGRIHPAARPAAPFATSFASRRWGVWQRQLEAGHEPCFGTSERFFCAETDCPFRSECLGLRAAWKR